MLKIMLIIFGTALLSGCGDTVTTIISQLPPSNTSPTANGGPDQSVVAGNTVLLNGSASSDPDGDFLGYKWVLNSKPLESLTEISCSECTVASFVADKPGNYSVSLSVHDGKIFSTPYSLTVTATAPPMLPGTVVRQIPFPPGVTFIGDMAYDRATSSFWALSGDNTKLSTWLKLDAVSGSYAITASNNATWINHGSSVAYDGQNLWATSYGWQNGVPQAFVYKLNSDGTINNSFACPSTATSGFCQGLAWDGASFWSGASDNKSLTKFGPDGTIVAQYPNVWDTVGLNDLAFDPVSQKLLVEKFNFMLFEPLLPPNFATYPFAANTYLGSGDWDGSYFWRANNSTQMVEVVYLGVVF